MATIELARINKIDTSRLSNRVRPRIKPRGLPQALEPYLVWETHDVTEACELGRELLGPTELAITDERPDDFYASYHAVRFRDITLGYLDYTAEVSVRSAELPASYLVLAPMSGSSVVVAGGERTEANAITAAIPPAGVEMTLECERQTPHLLVRVSEDPLLSHLGRILGRPLESGLVFDQRFDMSHPRASRWNIAIQVLHAELLEADSLLRSGVGVGHLEEFVMSALLFAHQSNYSEYLTRPGQGEEHRATRAAKAFIETNLANPIAVNDIAEAAGVSERTLQAAFRRELGMAPMAYVRDRRLDRARHDLADAVPGDYVSVTAIALRWGFGHLGRFAAEYKSRFGETPSQTLRG